MNSKRDFLIEKRKENKQFFLFVNVAIILFYSFIIVAISLYNKDTTFWDLLYFEILLFFAWTFYLPYEYIFKKGYEENIQDKIEIFKKYGRDEMKDFLGTNIVVNSLFFIITSAYFLFNQSYHLDIQTNIDKSELKTINGTALVNYQCDSKTYFGGRDEPLNFVADRFFCHRRHQQSPFSINGLDLYAGSDFYKNHSNKIDKQKITVFYKNEEMTIENPFFALAIPLAIIKNEKSEKPVVYEIRDEFGNLILSDSYFNEQYKKQRNNYWTILTFVILIALCCVIANIYANWKFTKNYITIKSICES